MSDDATLLRRYAEEGSEAAFTELVRRHVDLVYRAALRRTAGDPHQAADVAQQVFTHLARHARRLSRHTVLSAWLHTATRNAALNLMISDQRRQAREAEAFALAPAGTAGDSADWERLRPLLDAAVDELPEADRAAVVLRYLEHCAFAEIGATLRVSEDAARMRTERALDKLRAALARRGITSTAAALGVVLANQPLISAPAGLAATLVSQSLAAAGAGITATTFATFMSTKLIVTAALGVLVGAGVGGYYGVSHSAHVRPPPSPEIPRLAREVTSLREDNRRLQAEVAELNGDIARLQQANAQLEAQQSAPPPPVPAPSSRDVTLGMARWEVQQATLNNLRQIDAARRQYQLEKGQPAGSIHALVGRGGYIRTVRTVDGEDYANLPMNPGEPLTVTTPNGITVTFDPSGVTTTHPEVPPEVLRVQELSPQVQGSITQAVAAYRAANNGTNPPNDQALLPYFASQEQQAAYLEFVAARKAAGM